MQKLKIYLLILLGVTTFYVGALKYGFSQDDYYFLTISKANSWADVFKFFLPWQQQGFAFFRPLGTQFYFSLFTSIFGMSSAPLPMHIFMIILQSVNGYLVYLLCSKLFKEEKLGILIGLAYAISSVHFLSLYYIAATQQLLAMTFSLLSLNAFISRKYHLASLYLVPGLLSKESALVTPAVAGIISLYQAGAINMTSVKKTFFKLVPYIVVTAIYLGIRFAVGVEVQSEYRPVFGLSLLSTIRWYLLFAFGAPEELLRYGLAGMGIRIGQFLTDFNSLGWLNLVSTFLVFLYFLRSIVRSKLLHSFLLLSWFFLALQ